MKSVFHLRLNSAAVEVLAPLPELQNTFSELGAAQCGYCTPGMLLMAMPLVRTHPVSDRQQSKEALAGKLCRCTDYGKILAPEVIGTAVQIAFRPAPPLDNTDLTLSYHKKMLRLHVARVLRQLAGLPVAPRRGDQDNTSLGEIG